MTSKPATLLGRATLNFRPSADGAKPISGQLSTVSTEDGRLLWLASDETASVERLALGGGEALDYAAHKTFQLHDYLDMPDAPEVEADLEGVTTDGGYLWVAGSHSLARKKPDRAEHGPDEALERLTEIKHQANRFVLARIPLGPGKDGLDEPHREVEAGGEVRRAAALKMSRGRNALARAIDEDVHFGPFLNVPAKENGFDIEGLAVQGNRLWLGLRGPVLRGFAIVLEIQVAESRPGRLKLKPLDEEGTRYRKHFLDLDGLGIRALLLEGQDLLILAGPTMDLDGPVRLYRWRGAVADETASSVVLPERVTRVLDLPFGEGFDHAEGVAILRPEGRAPMLLTVYDTPGPERLSEGGARVTADLFAYPEEEAPPKLARPSAARRRGRPGAVTPPSSQP